MENNMIDKLLKLDKERLAGKTAKVEIKRLGIVVTVKSLSNETFAEINNDTIKFDKKGNFEGVDTYNQQIKLCLAGILDPDLKDKRLKEHFESATPKELLNKLFNTFELAKIAGEISKLCGMEYTQETADKEIKN